MFLTIAIILVVLWIGGLVLSVAGRWIDPSLVLGLIALVVHLMTG